MPKRKAKIGDVVFLSGTFNGLTFKNVRGVVVDYDYDGWADCGLYGIEVDSLNGIMTNRASWGSLADRMPRRHNGKYRCTVMAKNITNGFGAMTVTIGGVDYI